MSWLSGLDGFTANVVETLASVACAILAIFGVAGAALIGANLVTQGGAASIPYLGTSAFVAKVASVTDPVLGAVAFLVLALLVVFGIGGIVWVRKSVTAALAS